MITLALEFFVSVLFATALAILVMVGINNDDNNRMF